MENELVHAMNRGVDKRAIVLDNKDRRRFVADLYMLNDTQSVNSTNYHFEVALEAGAPYRSERARNPLVQIHAWILMNNHYHLLLSPIVDNGVSRFLQKLNMGYAKYFNERYERVGALFQGKTKRVPIATDAHYLWLIHYIHLNALDMHKSLKKWRDQCITQPALALNVLKKYPWSSYRDYLDESAFPEIVRGSFMYHDRTHIVKETVRFLHNIPGTLESTLTLE